MRALVRCTFFWLDEKDMGWCGINDIGNWCENGLPLNQKVNHQVSLFEWPYSDTKVSRFAPIGTDRAWQSVDFEPKDMLHFWGCEKLGQPCSECLLNSDMEKGQSLMSGGLSLLTSRWTSGFPVQLDQEDSPTGIARLCKWRLDSSGQQPFWRWYIDVHHGLGIQ